MSAKRLQIGIIGAGRIGKVHAATVAFALPEAKIISITDLNRDAALELASRCDIPAVAASSEEILSDPRIDAVLICSSTDTHGRLIGEAARAAKHIFCEKPIAHELAKIDAALEAVAKAGVKLQIGFNRRFDGNFARVKRAVEAGEVGTPRLMHIVSRDPFPPPISFVKTSGGMFLDMTIHDFDMARFLIGDEVEEVFVAGGVMVDPAIGAAGDLDTAVIVLRFRSGAIGTIDNCRQAAYGYDQRVEILGSLGKIATENLTPTRQWSRGQRSAARPAAELLHGSLPGELRGRTSLFCRGGYPRHAHARKRGGRRIPTVMALAARKSYDEHRPVRLAEISEGVLRS